MVEAISLQATFLFGLLRYARNDKSQDRHTAQVPFAMTTLHLLATCHCEPQRGEAIYSPVDRHTTFAMTTLHLPLLNFYQISTIIAKQ